MNIGQKAKVIKTGELVEITGEEKEEFETVFVLGQKQDIFVDKQGNIRTGRFMTHEVKYLSGPNKGTGTVMKVSELSPEPES